VSKLPANLVGDTNLFVGTPLLGKTQPTTKPSCGFSPQPQLDSLTRFNRQRKSQSHKGLAFRAIAQIYVACGLGTKFHHPLWSFFGSFDSSGVGEPWPWATGVGGETDSVDPVVGVETTTVSPITVPPSRKVPTGSGH